MARFLRTAVLAAALLNAGGCAIYDLDPAVALLPVGEQRGLRSLKPQWYARVVSVAPDLSACRVEMSSAAVASPNTGDVRVGGRLPKVPGTLRSPGIVRVIRPEAVAVEITALD